MTKTTEDVNIRLNVLNEQGMKSMRDMKEEAKLLNLAMSEAAGKGSKDEFDALATRLGALRNDMADTSKAMKMLDPGEILGGFTRMAEGAVGAFATITSAMSLFGSENERLQEIEKKSMQVIQLMMGLEKVRQLLIDQGARQEMAATLIATKRLAVSAAVKLGIITETAAVIGLTAAETGEAVASNVATSATWKWNAALMANPAIAIAAAVVLLVAGIVALVSVMDDSKTSSELAAESAKNYDESMKDLVDSSKEVRASLSEDILQWQVLSGVITQSEADIISYGSAYTEAVHEMIVSNVELTYEFEKKQAAERAAFNESRGWFESTSEWIKRRTNFEKEQTIALTAIRQQAHNNLMDLRAKESVQTGSRILQDAKANSSAARSFEEGVVKQISSLRISLIRDEYEQKMAAINESYKADKANLDAITKQQKVITDLYDKKKSDIDSTILALQQSDAGLKLNRNSAEGLADTYSRLADEAGKAGNTEKQAEYLRMQTEQLMKSREITSSINANSAQMDTLKTVQKEINIEIEKGNAIINKTERELEVRVNLEREVLKTQRLIKTESDAVSANLSLALKVRQLTVDVMTDGLDKTKAQLLLEKQLSEEEIKRAEAANKQRQDILDKASTAQKDTDEWRDANDKNLEEFKLLQTEKTLVAKKYDNDVKKAAVDSAKSTNAEIKDDAIKSMEDVSKERESMYDEWLNLSVQNAEEFSAEQLYFQKEQIDRENEAFKDAQIEKYNVSMSYLGKTYADEMELITDMYGKDLLSAEEFEIEKQKIVDKYNKEERKLDNAYNAVTEESEELARKKKEDLDKAAAKRIRDFMIDQTQILADATAEIMNNQMDAVFERQQKDMEETYNAQMDAINSTSEARIAMGEEETLVKLDQENQLKALEDKKKQDDLDYRIRMFKYEQKSAIVSIAIQTALAIMKAAPNPLAMIAAGVVGVAQGAVVAMKQAPQFALGGLVNGRKHAQGGTLIEAEQGEVVLNARSMSNPILRNIASSINVQGGGVPIPNSAPVSNSSAIGLGVTREEMSEMMTELYSKVTSIPVVLVESDVTKSQRRVSTYESNARI